MRTCAVGHAVSVAADSDKWSSQVENFGMPPKTAKRVLQKTMATKKTPAPKTSTTKRNSASISKVTTGKKRQNSNSHEVPREKQQKTCSLTTVDIPEIVTAVVNSLPQAGPVTPNSTQSGKCTIRTANHRSPRNVEQPGQSSLQHSSSNREVSSSSDFEEEGDKDPKNEEFGKSMHAMWYCHVTTVLIHMWHVVASCYFTLLLATINRYITVMQRVC